MYVSAHHFRVFVVQIPSLDVIFMGYCMAVQVRTMISIVMYKSKFRVGDMILRRVLVMLFEIFFRTHLINISIVALLGICRGRVGGLGDAL